MRPWSPDGLPLLVPAPGRRGVYIDTGYDTGYHRNGILLAPGSAALLADLLAGESGGERLAPFAPGRFASDVARDEPRTGWAVTP
ncbi:MAG TPA: hypothetical protein VFW96_10995 [Thermomicrobiales bacterium]|nr:hypothetical protein [Thermomicrobiales bacterium]